MPALVRRSLMLEWRDSGGASREAVLKSGKLSSPGDSGIVSRRGVDRPLATGGPQPCPSDCCISRAL